MLSFDPHLSLVLGGNDRAALLVYEVHRRSAIRYDMYRDGHYWAVKTYEGWLKTFPSWKSVRAARRVVERARNLGVLVTKKSHDRPMLYRVDYDALRQLFMAADIPIPNWMPKSDPQGG